MTFIARCASVLALSLVACGKPVAPAESSSSASAAPASKHAPVGVAPSPDGPSLYELPITLLDRTGTSRPLGAFRGAPLLVTMFYGSCASACPLLTSDLKRIEAALPPEVRGEVRVLMVSFDQARDTPPVLGRMTVERGMDPSRWTLASTSDDDARSLAGVLGIRYRKLDSGEFFHSSAIVLLDGDGRISARLDGLGRDPAPIVNALAPHA